MKISSNDDVNFLISATQNCYPNLMGIYKQAINEKVITDLLRLEVFHYLSDARAVLDYCAYDIYSSLSNIGKKKTDRIYFPILKKDETVQQLEKKYKWLVSLRDSNPNLYCYIEGVQPCHPEYAWLADFADIHTECKHLRLTPQSRKEVIAKSISSQGSNITISGDAIIRIGKGCQFQIGDAVIKGEQSISPTSELFACKGRLETKNEIWVDIKFRGNISAVNLFRHIHESVPVLVKDMYELLLCSGVSKI